MTPTASRRPGSDNRGNRSLLASLRQDEGTEILELAVSLPLLVILVVGIYDFGSAFTLKYKLNNALFEGLRVASSQPARDLSRIDACGASPPSICVVRDVVASSLQASIGDDCGLSTSPGSPSGTLAWTFAGNCPDARLQIERGVLNPGGVILPNPFDDSDPFRIENTRITLSYPYQWRFNRAIQVVAPGANYLSTRITVSALMQNTQ